MMDISTKSLRSLLSGSSVSENIIFRLNKGFDYILSHPGSNAPMMGLPGDWRYVEDEQVNLIIAEVSDRLVVLKRLIQQKNSLYSSESKLMKFRSDS